MADKVATFAVDLAGNVTDVAKKDAAELEALRAKIESTKKSIADLSAANRSLKGSSDEISKAKETLTAKINAEKGALSQANLALFKQGMTLKDVTAASKKQAAATGDVKEGMSSLLGPVAAVGAAVTLVGVAIAAAGVELGKFVLEGADMLRSMGLVREAASGSAENAAALGTQVDDLSHKVATSKDKLNELGSAIVRNLSGGLSRASGQAIEDTFYAVSQASAAMGDSVGGTLQGLVERGKMWNRFSLAPQDLDKTQLQFQEVAASLAKNLGIGLDAAKARLFRGQVSLEQGAKALRDAVEARFGEVNSKKLLSLDVQLAKLKERFTNLTAGVMPVLEPILEGVAKLFSLFDDTTASGETLKGIFTFIGQAISDIAPDVFDELKLGIEEAEGSGLDLLLWLKAMNDDLKDYGGFWGIAKSSMELAVDVARIAIWPFKELAIAIEAYARASKDLQSSQGDVDVMGNPVAGIAENLDESKAGLKDSAVAAGKATAEGLASGLAGGKDMVSKAGADLADAAHKGFTDAAEIQSPSKLFERSGAMMPEGAARGIDKGAPDVQAAADRMAPSPGGGGGGAPAGGSSAPIVININLPESMGAQKAGEVKQALSAPSFMAQLTKAVREAMVGAAVPTQAGTAP